jgi:hypothetical protein
MVHAIIYAFIERYLARIRRDHVWLRILAPSIDSQLAVSRPQRVAILATAMVTSMAVNAFFFGVGTRDGCQRSAVFGGVLTRIGVCPDPKNVGDRIFTALASVRWTLHTLLSRFVLREH